jgi:hypothetical protein
MTQVTIVCGPPGAGKSRYVLEHLHWGDLVLDIDTLFMALSGQVTYGKPVSLLKVVLRVRDTVITIRAVGTPITELGVSLAGKFDWHWTGSLAVGKDLIIDCGTKRITNDGADAYAGFALQAGHADNDWLPLDVGVSTISVHLTGGASSTFKLDYADGWS